MKRALAILAVCSLFGTFALGQEIGGSWSVDIGFAPLAAVCGTLYPSIDLSSTLEIDYTFCGFTFASISTFTESGFDTQKFTAEGMLGPVELSSTIKFYPSYATEKTATLAGIQTSSTCCYWKWSTTKAEPKFDDWKVEATLEFGGVKFGGLFFLERGRIDTTYTGFFTGDIDNPSWSSTQTLSTCLTSGTLKNGSGWRFMVSGTFNDCTVTSYTYFNLYEYSQASLDLKAAGYVSAAVTDLTLAKGGVFKIPNDGCDMGFYEEYLLIEGITFGCATMDAALMIRCTGFSSFDVLFDDLPFFCCGLTTDLKVSFDIDSKSITLKPKFAMDYACIVFDIGTDFSAHEIKGFNVYGFSWSAELADCLTISSDTSFNLFVHPIKSDITGGAKAWYYVPAVYCIYDSNAYSDLDQDGVYEIECVDKYAYKVWEEFTVEACLPGCCGDQIEFSATTYWGDKYEAAGYGFAYYNGNTWVYYWADSFGGTLAVDTTGKFSEAYDEEYADAGWTWAEDSAVYEAYNEYLVTLVDYDAATANTLFGWVETEIDLSIPVSSAVSATVGLDVSVFGVENVELGFSIAF